MKKLFAVFSVLMILASFLLVPNQDVFAKVSVTNPLLIAYPQGFPVCDPENVWTSGGVTHWRDCIMQIYYTSSEDLRLVGMSTFSMNRNIFSVDPLIDYPAVGHGNWVLEAELVDGGYWAGTFTANKDDLGNMTVKIRGKGYGSLKGLMFDTVATSMGGAGSVTITTLPSYNGPGPLLGP